MNALAKKENNEVMIMDFEQYAGTGFEGVEGRDRKIPLIRIAEALSKCLEPSSEKYIEGAKKGDIIDTSLNMALGDTVEVLIVKVECLYYEWENEIPVKVHPNADILENCEWRGDDGSKKGHFLDNGNEVQKTFVFYGINLSNGGAWCSIPMSRARLGAGDTFLSRLESVKLGNGSTAPPFYQTWKLSSKSTMSKNSKPYYTWSVEPGTKLEAHENGQALYTEAVTFQNILREGKASLDIDEMSEKDVDTNGAM